MIRCISVLLVFLLFAIPPNGTILLDSGPISQQGGSVIRNILGTQVYEDHVVTSSLDASSFWRAFTRWLKETLRSLLGETGTRNTGTFLQRRLAPTVRFPCNVTGQRSLKIPDSVHQLRPGDIDVIAAIGDSITAGSATNGLNFFESFIENRGLSFSIGGYGNFRTHLTLPNILKVFNPRFIGYSTKDAFNWERPTQFNVAEPIATSSDMPYMAYVLQRRMRADRR